MAGALFWLSDSAWAAIDERRYKDRWRVKAMFCRLKDFRRIATRYDKLARNYLSAVALDAAIAFWLRMGLDPDFRLATGTVGRLSTATVT